MLEQLLKEIKRGGPLQLAVLAARLNVSTGLIEAMLEDLERMGRISEVSSECGSACGSCPVSGICSPGGDKKNRVWVFNERAG